MNTLFKPDLQHLSRREFLRYASGGLMGLFTLPFLTAFERAERLNRPLMGVGIYQPEVRMGRTVDNDVRVFNKPSFSAELQQAYWRDLVFEIDDVAFGDQEPSHNRVWYHIRGLGFAHSGQIQPVDLRTNPTDVTLNGDSLVEVTVPYTDVFIDYKKTERALYRLYYSTLHWASRVATDDAGQKWYRLYDDKFRRYYYGRAEHFRLLTAEDVAPISPDVPIDVKRVEIWLKDQLVIAYEYNEPVMITRAATGGKFIDGDYSTPTGIYTTNRKRPSRHMANGDLAAPNSYDLPGIPWVTYLTISGISFHGTYWHNDFGKPRSHGCINLSSEAAQWLYRWSSPAVPFEKATFTGEFGTPVQVI